MKASVLTLYSSTLLCALLIQGCNAHAGCNVNAEGWKCGAGVDIPLPFAAELNPHLTKIFFLGDVGIPDTGLVKLQAFNSQGNLISTIETDWVMQQSGSAILENPVTVDNWLYSLPANAQLEVEMVSVPVDHHVGQNTFALRWEQDNDVLGTVSTTFFVSPGNCGGDWNQQKC
jgi:hypothetical protein